MSLLAPTLQAFFTDRLITQRNASPQTVASYRDTFRLLLAFAQKQTGKHPCRLDFDDLDAPLIGAFLKHLEDDVVQPTNLNRTVAGKTKLSEPLHHITRRTTEERLCR